MNSFAYRTCSFVVLLCCCPLAAWSADTTASDPTERAYALVRQLASESYSDREAAMKQLNEIGKKAEKALRLGLNDPDAEVRMRCQQMLARLDRTELQVALDAFLENKDTELIHKVPTWNRFRTLVGQDGDARSLFVQMCCAESALMEAVEKDKKNATQKVTARLQELTQAMATPLGLRNQQNLGQVAALLFLLSDESITLSPTTPAYVVTNMLYQAETRAAFTNDPAARKLLVAYIERNTQPHLAHQNLNLAIQFNLKEAVEPALKIALAKNQQGYTKAMALMVIGRLGGKEHLEKIEPLLTDTTVVTTFQTGQMRLTAQVRDVALGMVIQLSGQQIMDYDFPALKQFPRNNMQFLYYSPHYFGFSDDTSRLALMKKWRDTQAAQVTGPEAPKNPNMGGVKK